MRKLLLACAALALLSAVIVLAVRSRGPVEPDVPPLPPAVAQAEKPPLVVAEIPGICTDFYRAVCGNMGETRDPTGVVNPDFEGEKQASQLVDEIVRAHPEWSGTQVDDELVRQIYTAKRTQKLQGAFQWAQRVLESFINRQPESLFNSAEKHRIRARIRATQLQLPPPASAYDDEPDLFTKTDVFYERTLDGKLRMRVGGAYLLSTKSWFNMVFTVAHELAHSIDPCEIRAFGMAFPAYDRLTACFLRDGLIAARSTRSECGQNDQLSETFADWIAVEITARALESFSARFRGPYLVAAAANAVRDLCEQDETVDSQFHPEPKIRIDRIFGQNPKIRSLLGCRPSHPDLPTYCGFGAFSPPVIQSGPVFTGAPNGDSHAR